MEVKCKPVLPTYPISRVVFVASSCSTVMFHCQEFGITPRGFFPKLGETDGFAKDAGVSNERFVLTPMTNGAVFAIPSSMPTDSRWKNWPPPTRNAVFPLPNTSQAIPTRGAMGWLLLLISARLPPGVPFDSGRFKPRPVRNFAAYAEGVGPGRIIVPLHASDGLVLACAALQEEALQFAQ